MTFPSLETYPTFHKILATYKLPLSISEMEQMLDIVKAFELTELEQIYYCRCINELKIEKSLRESDIIQAKEKGRRVSLVQIRNRMIEFGFSKEVIMRLTGLNSEEVDVL